MYRPWTTRLVGVEMETTRVSETGGPITAEILHNAVGRAIAAHHGQRSSRIGEYFQSNGQTWDVKRDGSCGYEVVTPAFRIDSAGHNGPLRDVCRELKVERPKVDRSCGLHVHVDVSDFDWRTAQMLMRFWLRYEPFFMELIPSNRRSNHYCMPHRGSRWNSRIPAEIASALRTNSQQSFERFARNNFTKYRSLNLAPFWMNHRVEFRLHSGTINYDKIRAWCMLVTSVVQRVVEPNMPAIETGEMIQPVSTSYMLRMLGLLPSPIRQDVPQESLELAAWVNARRLQFNGGVVPNAAPAAPAVARRHAGTCQRILPMISSSTDVCRADVPGTCRERPAGGRVLCQTHLEDYLAREDYRMTGVTA